MLHSSFAPYYSSTDGRPQTGSAGAVVLSVQPGGCLGGRNDGGSNDRRETEIFAGIQKLLNPGGDEQSGWYRAIPIPT